MSRAAGSVGAGGGSVEAVVLDYGGVLTTPVGDSAAAWLERDRIDPASFSRVLKAWLSRGAPDVTPIHRLETGAITVAEFDRLLAAELVGLDGTPVPTEGLLTGLFAELRADEAMFGLVEELRALGVRTALLSNSWGNTYPRDRLDAAFDPVLVSGELGLRKPDPAIFAHLLDLLDLPAERVVFVDDAEPNTQGPPSSGCVPSCTPTTAPPGPRWRGCCRRCARVAPADPTAPPHRPADRTNRLNRLNRLNLTEGEP
jgi:putative hydrolase of the HAD superfamily